MDVRAHWDRVYTSHAAEDLSWFEALPAVSLAMLEAAGVAPDACVLDVGGGESRLTDQLIARGFECLAVLDVSAAALQRAKARLGDAAAVPIWLNADVTGQWTLKPMDVWHDRAVFHFLSDEADRARYLRHLQDTLKPNGTAIIATFAPDGPERCSGLPVVRYSAAALAATLGGNFELVQTVPHQHRTPRGAVQSFQYSRFRRLVGKGQQP